MWRAVELRAANSLLELGFFNHKMVLVPSASKFQQLAGKAFMFGGLDHGYQLLDQAYRATLDTFRASFAPIDARGRPPPPRHSHSMKLMQHFDGVVVSGGKGAEDRVLGDLWIFSLVKQQWREVDLQFPAVPRASHEVLLPHQVVVSDNELYLFGGYNEDGFIDSAVTKLRIVTGDDLHTDDERKKSLFKAARSLKKPLIDALSTLKRNSIVKQASLEGSQLETHSKKNPLATAALVRQFTKNFKLFRNMPLK